MEKFNIYINEITKFEIEQVESSMLGTLQQEKLLRLPKYNQNTGDYAKYIFNIESDCYDSVIFWDNDKIKIAIYHLNEILLQFKKYFEFEKKYYNLISQQSDQFHYATFIDSFKNLFGIFDNVNTICGNKFSGDYGLITTKFIEDLYDALIFKEASLIFIIEKLEKRLRLSDTKKKSSSKDVREAPSYVLKVWSIYKNEYDKHKDHIKALTKTVNEVEKDKERTMFNSQEVDENKRHKNIKDSIRTQFKTYGLL